MAASKAPSVVMTDEDDEGRKSSETTKRKLSSDLQAPAAAAGGSSRGGQAAAPVSSGSQDSLGIGGSWVVQAGPKDRQLDDQPQEKVSCLSWLPFKVTHPAFWSRVCGSWGSSGTLRS